MSNETNLLSQSVCNTWANVDTPVDTVLIITAVVSKTILEATVNKCRELTSLVEGVTDVRIDREAVIAIGMSIAIFAELVIIMREVQGNSNIKLVIEFVTNLRSECEFVFLVSSGSIITFSFNVVTEFTTYPNLSVSCERRYCNECSQK